MGRRGQKGLFIALEEEKKMTLKNSVLVHNVNKKLVCKKMTKNSVTGRPQKVASIENHYKVKGCPVLFCQKQLLA